MLLLDGKVSFGMLFIGSVLIVFFFLVNFIVMVDFINLFWVFMDVNGEIEINMLDEKLIKFLVL